MAIQPAPAGGLVKIRRDVPLGPLTTLGVGGPARFLVEAASEDDARRAVEMAARESAPLFVLGGGSNLLVADEGFPGVVLRVMLKGVAVVSGEGSGRAGGAGPAAGAGPRRPRVLLRAAAGEEWDGVVAFAVERGLAGIECLSGIPGTVGATPVQNVGAYGQEVSTVIEVVTALDRATGVIDDLGAAECGFGYRSSVFNTTRRDRHVILGVTCALTPGGPAQTGYADLAEMFVGSSPPPSLLEVREAVRAIRRRKGMLLVPEDPDSRSAGSFFRNPIVDAAALARLQDRVGADLPVFPGAGAVTAAVPGGVTAEGPGSGPGGTPSGAAAAPMFKVPAARLIEAAGFARGYRRGAAGISTKHSLALVNRGGATAREIFDLAREIRDRVRDRFGVDLKPEPVLLGFTGPF